MRTAWIVTALIAAMVVHSPVRGQEAARSSPSPGTTIGVVSLLRNELHIRYRAPTAIGSDHYMDEVPEWALDEFTAGATAAILGRLFRYRFEALTGGSVGSTLDPVFVVAEQRGWATVVTIDRKENPRPSYYEGGHGLWIRKNAVVWRSPEIECAFSWLVFEIWDVATRDRLEKREEFRCERDESIGDIEVRDQYADYSAAEKAQIEALVKTSLLRSAEAAASDIKLFRQ